MVEIIKTKDGSHTLFDYKLNESFHSMGGAISESEYVYIRNGLDYLLNSFIENIRILEVGFGTGLNCYLTYNEIENYEVILDYHSLDIEKIDDTIWRNLNYTKLLHNMNVDFFNFIHESFWDKHLIWNKKFSLTKHLCSIDSFESNKKFDLVYFDAFGANKQKDIWTINIFRRIYELMNPNSVLVTYACTSKLKSILQDLGFVVQVLPGALTKREMIRAIK